VAEFLRVLIGDREFTLYVNGTAEEYRKGKGPPDASGTLRTAVAFRPLQVVTEPVGFVGRDVRAGALRILAAVRLAVGTVAVSGRGVSPTGSA